MPSLIKLTRLFFIVSLTAGAAQVQAGKLVELDESMWFCDSYQAAVALDNAFVSQNMKWDDEEVQNYAKSHGCGQLRVGTQIRVLNDSTIQRGDVKIAVDDIEGFVSQYALSFQPFYETLSEETVACTTLGAWAEKMGGYLSSPKQGDITPDQHCIELEEGTTVVKEPRTRNGSFYRIYLNDEQLTNYWLNTPKQK